MYLSPELKQSFARFRKNKRAFYSLSLLLIMIVLSLPAELIFNNRPLFLSVDGKLFFPFVSEISMEDLGGKSTIPIQNWQGKELMDFLDGVETKKADVDALFGSDDDDDSFLLEEEPETAVTQSVETITTAGITTAKKKDYYFLWAPIRYDYKARTENPTSGKHALISPEESSMDGHYLGTDRQGMDVLARLVYGFRISIFFGLGLAVSGTIFGSFLGGLQGYFGGLVDLFGQRFTEIWGSLPQLYLLIIMSSFVTSKMELAEGVHYLILFGILNLTAWMGMAAYMRAEFLRSRNLDYVKAAKALGVSDFKIMLHHILPNSLTPIITFFPFEISAGILALVSLDFLGLGVRYPAPSLGELLNQGKDNLHALWIFIPTFIVLTLTLTLLTFINDGVRNAFDPHKK